MSNRYLHKHKWIAVLLCLCFMMSFILPGYAADGEVGGGDTTVSDAGSTSDSTGDSGSGESSGDVTGGDNTTGGDTDTTEPAEPDNSGDGNGETTTEPTNPDNGGEGTVPPTEGGDNTGEVTPPVEEGTNPPTEGETTPPTTEETTVVCDVCGAAEGEHHVNSDCPYYPHLVGCNGEECVIEGCACPCHQPSKLYERLMLCETYAAMDAALKGAEIWEYPLMTNDEKAAVQAKLAELKTLDKHDVEGCTDECTGEDCACKCHHKFEHLEGCDGINCTLEGCQCPCHLLINRVLATTTMEEYYHVMGTATDEELTALTEEEQAQIDAHFMELLSLPIQAVNFTNAAPLVESVFAFFDSFVSMFADEEPVAPEENGLELSKTATPNEDGSYTIKLEAYTTGTVTTIVEEKPVDIVVMVDNSNKFLPQNLGETGPTVGAALKKELTAFIGDLAKTSDKYRISFVFAGADTEATGWYTLDESGKTDAINKVVTSLDEGGKSGQSDHVKALPAVDTLLESSKLDTKKVVILFSAGIPHGKKNENTWDPTNPEAALPMAKKLKDAGTTIYSVGIFKNANGNLDVLPGYVGDNDGEITADKKNRYLHYISSNYPSAISMSGTYDLASPKPDKGGYYLTTEDASGLDNIFESIKHQIATPSIPLNESTQIIDSIAEAFEVPENTDAISCSTADYLSNGNWEDAKSANYNVKIENESVIVDGFNFDDNFITEDAKSDGSYGKKLIITFTVKQKAGFLGGNNVFTNGNDSGVYNTESGFNEKFINPKVNIPIPDVMVTAEDKNVYLLDSVTGAQLQQNATVKIGDVVLDFTKPNYGLEKWQNEYVDFLPMVVKDASANVITDTGLNNILLDQEYQLAFTVSPKNEADETLLGTPAVAKNGDAKGGINVFKPELSFKDSQVYYGDVAPIVETYTTGNYEADKTVWRHGNTVDKDVTMIGTETPVNPPELVLTYLPDETKLTMNSNKEQIINSKQDIPVQVKVEIQKISDTTEAVITDVTNHITFQHTDCMPDCAWKTVVSQGKGNPAFLLHPQTCQLTITKTGGASDEPYVFDVYKDGTKYSEVTIVGNDSEIIYELPVGEYSIAEKTGWSWRFTPSYSANATLSKDATSGGITCTNTNDNNNKWLNGYSNVIKNIFGVTH